MLKCIANQKNSFEILEKNFHIIPKFSYVIPDFASGIVSERPEYRHETIVNILTLVNAAKGIEN